MFIHDAKIPLSFAMAVYAILHNMAAVTHWREIDQHLDPALAWIQSIYLDNGKPWTLDELNWWCQQLLHNPNLN